jgi:hypothetical protein
MDCFEAVKSMMQNIFGLEAAAEKRRTPPNRLLKLLKDSVQF